MRIARLVAAAIAVSVNVSAAAHEGLCLAQLFSKAVELSAYHLWQPYLFAFVSLISGLLSVLLQHRFINRDDLDFSTIANMQPTQEWDLQEVNNGTLEYPTQ